MVDERLGCGNGKHGTVAQIMGGDSEAVARLEEGGAEGWGGNMRPAICIVLRLSSRCKCGRGHWLSGGSWSLVGRGSVLDRKQD